MLRDVEIARIAFNIGLVIDRKGAGISICDIGGGIGLFSVGCAALGMRSILVDDFGDSVNREVGESVLAIHRSHGVEIIYRDVIKDGLELPPESLDVVTSFGVIEHCHNSPKGLFRAMLRALKPGGLWLMGAPNCMNLRKRVAMPLGFGGWSAMNDWYEQSVFRGHVREPSVRDLRYIARDLGLSGVQIIGRNWIGYKSPAAFIRRATGLLDYLLRVRPSLCADIYMLGTKPQVDATRSQVCDRHHQHAHA